MDEQAVEKWIELQNKECTEKFPNNPDLKYASLCGKLEAKLLNMFADERIREAAIQNMKEDLEGAQ